MRKKVPPIRKIMHRDLRYNLKLPKVKYGYRRNDLSDFSQEYDFEHTGLENTFEDLPIDLQKYRLTQRRGQTVPGISPGQAYDRDAILSKIAGDTDILASINVLDKGLIGRAVTVGTTATRIIQAQFLRGYRILNPSTIVGTTAFGTLLTSASRSATGNTQADSLGVANYRDLHLFLNVTAVPGGGATLDINTQALDPASLNWVSIQNIFTGITSTGTYYANVGSLGLTTDFAIAWTISSGNFTFSIGYVLKEGLPGTSNGISKTIYIGNSGVTTNSGFPLLEGQSLPFFLRENTELWAIAAESLELRIFEL